MRHPGGERFAVELVALDGEAPACVRLRRFLKAALRTWGLRCTSCRAVTPPEGTPQAAQGGTKAEGAAAGPSEGAGPS